MATRVDSLNRRSDDHSQLIIVESKAPPTNADIERNHSVLVGSNSRGRIRLQLSIYSKDHYIVTPQQVSTYGGQFHIHSTPDSEMTSCDWLSLSKSLIAHPLIEPPGCRIRTPSNEIVILMCPSIDRHHHSI